MTLNCILQPINHHHGDEKWILEKISLWSASYGYFAKNKEHILKQYNDIFTEKSRRDANLFLLNQYDFQKKTLDLFVANPLIAFELFQGLNKVKRRYGEVVALEKYNQWKELLTITQHTTFSNKISAGIDSNSLKEYAQSLAKYFVEKQTRWEEEYQSIHGDYIQYLFKKTKDYLKSIFFDIDIKKPPQKQEDIYRYIISPCDENYWLRRLKTIKNQRIDQLMRSELGVVGAGRQVFCSDWVVKNKIYQEKSNRDFLESTKMRNQYGQEFTLLELSEAGQANPVNRRTELMMQAKAFDDYAKEHNHICLFVTMTTPTQYHALIKFSGFDSCASRKNSKYQGFNPNHAQAWLCGKWSKIRAQLNRDHIRFYGTRTVEPHHDGTPHWHLVVFLCEKDKRSFINIIKHHMFHGETLTDIEQRSRVDIKEQDLSKGSSVGYIAKYISKNIDGFGLETEKNDESGDSIKNSLIRIKAWASCWHIRQFQQLGGVSKTVYRECRKIKQPHISTYQNKQNESIKWSEAEQAKVEKIRAAADRGDFFEYMKLQGGAMAKRKDQILRPFNCIKIGMGHLSKQVRRFLHGLSDEIKKPFGISIQSSKSGNNQKTRYYQWEVITPVSDSYPKEQSSLPWTSVNNCTEDYFSKIHTRTTLGLIPDFESG